MPTAFTDRSRREPTGLPARVVYMRQVHGAEVAYVTEPFGTPPFDASCPGLDAVFTDQPGLALGVAVADCAPVLITAPGRAPGTASGYAEIAPGAASGYARIAPGYAGSVSGGAETAPGSVGAGAVPRWIGAAHSGRTGTDAGVVPALVRAMAARGADVAAMSAVIGPNACGKCYEVPAEMRADVAATLPATWATTRQGTPALDIRAGIVAQLTALGVTTIQHDDRCTIESPELCSYRRDRSRACFAGFVWLP